MRRQARGQPGAWRSVALIQALSYLLTGIWPLVHIRSFERLTGPKVDRWLVKTVGMLVALIGAALGSVGLRGWAGGDRCGLRRAAAERADLPAGCDQRGAADRWPGARWH